MTRLRACLAAGVAAAVAGGCGGTTIDGDKLEDEIMRDAEAAGLVLDDAVCPSPDAEADDRFDCTVTVKGEQRQLEIVQRNDEGNVGYDLEPLLESRAGSDAGGDEAAITFVIDAVNGDATALCEYATRAYRRALTRRSGESCAAAALAERDEPIEDYGIAVHGDTARITETAPDGERTVTLERADDGSWLISRFE